MDSMWAQLLIKVLEVSPYLVFVFIAFASAYYMFRVSVKEIREQADKAIHEIRQAYDRADERRPRGS